MFARSYTVPVGTPTIVPVHGHGIPASVTANPGASGTLAVAYSTSPPDTPGSAVWRAWDAGAVAVSTTAGLSAPITLLRFTAATSAGTGEVCW